MTLWELLICLSLGASITFSLVKREEYDCEAKPIRRDIGVVWECCMPNQWYNENAQSCVNCAPGFSNCFENTFPSCYYNILTNPCPTTTQTTTSQPGKSDTTTSTTISTTTGSTSSDMDHGTTYTTTASSVVTTEQTTSTTKVVESTSGLPPWLIALFVVLVVLLAAGCIACFFVHTRHSSQKESIPLPESSSSLIENTST